jgi:hypothetical protein
MVRYLQGERTAEEYFRDYGEYLREKPEDETPPRDVGSLYAHSKLVGKIFRVLKSNLEPSDNPLDLTYAGEPVQTLKEAEGDDDPKSDVGGKWRYRLLNCQVKIPQTIVRARDLNVFLLRDECMPIPQIHCCCLLRLSALRDCRLFSGFSWMRGFISSIPKSKAT